MYGIVPLKLLAPGYGVSSLPRKSPEHGFRSSLSLIDSRPIPPLATLNTGTHEPFFLAVCPTQLVCQGLTYMVSSLLSPVHLARPPCPHCPTSAGLRICQPSPGQLLLLTTPPHPGCARFPDGPQLPGTMSVSACSAPSCILSLQKSDNRGQSWTLQSLSVRPPAIYPSSCRVAASQV